MSLDKAFRKRAVYKLVISQLEILPLRCPHQKTTDEGLANPHYEAMCEMFAEDLSGFDEHALEAGMREFRQTWKYQKWPSIAELYALFRDQASLRRRDDEPKLEPVRKPHQAPGYWDREREENDRYDRQVLGIEPLGKRASPATKQEIKAYWARREAAMRAKGIGEYARRRHEPLAPLAVKKFMDSTADPEMQARSDQNLEDELPL